MDEINERELLKSTSDIFIATCSICGKKFYSKRPLKRKYCRECNIKRRQKNNIKKNLTNNEFKFLYNRFYRLIYKITTLFINPGHPYFEFVIEQSFVSLYLQWIRMLEKGCKFENLEKIRYSTIFFFVKISYYSVLRCRDLPSRLDASCKGLSLIEKETLSLDSPKFNSLDCADSLIEYIIDKKSNIDFLFDLKKLTKQIMIESVFDSDIKAAVVRAELSDIDVKTASISEDKKISLINNNYNLDVKSTAQLKKKAQLGIYKLYNAYAPEIKDILEMSDSDFRINTQGKELQKIFLRNPLRKCIICGKPFISYEHNVLVCSKKCAAIRANEKKKELRKKNRLKELSNSVFMASSLDETKKNLSEILKLIDEIN